jgi:hypothetical protein
VAVGLISSHQRDIGGEVDKQPGIQLDIGVDGTDFQTAILQQLADAQALRAGEGKSSLRAMPLSKMSRCSAGPRWE